MTKIGLVSDSHGNIKSLKKAIDLMMPVDLIFHMGDYVTDADEIKRFVSVPVMAVKGNMDSYIDDRPEFVKTTVDGKTVLIVHGHKQLVKHTKEDLAVLAKSEGADIALFGHTHIPYWNEINGVTLINPGSCSLPNGGEKSFAVLTIDGDEIDVAFHEFR